MGLTWRDLVSSVALAGVVLAYGAYESRASLPLVSTTSAASALCLVLAAACAVPAAWDLHTRPQRGLGLAARRTTTVTGTIAIVAGLIGLVADSGRALEFLVIAVILLWLTAWCWHAYTIGADE
jgi:cobalamin synthase